MTCSVVSAVDSVQDWAVSCPICMDSTVPAQPDPWEESCQS